MSEPERAAVLRECRSLTRYLIGSEPGDVVLHAYARGLESSSFLRGPPGTPLDDVLVSLATAGPMLAGIADAWARFFAPAGQLRRRLVLLLAILESVAPECNAVDQPGTGRIATTTAILLAGMGFAGRLLLALVIVLPLHLSAAVRGRLGRGAAASGAGEQS